MMNSDEILETGETRINVTTLIKLLAVLSYIGYGLIALALTIATLYFFFGKESVSGAFSTGIHNSFVVHITVMVSVCLLAIIGATQMHQGKRKGFIVYAIGAGLFAIDQIFLFNPQIQNFIIGGISIAFIIGFLTQLKNLN